MVMGCGRFSGRLDMLEYFLFYFRLRPNGAVKISKSALLYKRALCVHHSTTSVNIQVHPLPPPGVVS